MERRDFVRGVLVSAGAGTALIRLATPEETQALAVGEPTAIVQPNKIPSMPLPMDAGAPVYVNREGKFVSIGYLTSYATSIFSHEDLTWSGEITFRGWK